MSSGPAASPIGVAAAIPGTVVQRIAGATGDADVSDRTVRFGHPSGLLAVSVRMQRRDGRWTVDRVTMQRSARRLMDGEVFVPAE